MFFQIIFLGRVERRRVVEPNRVKTVLKPHLRPPLASVNPPSNILFAYN
jgi:hypothetical protein